MKNTLIAIHLALLLVIPVSYATNTDLFFEGVESLSPGELAYHLDVGKSCPSPLKPTQAEIDGVFKNMGIKPLARDAYLTEDIYLKIRLRCIRNDENLMYRMEIRFGQNNSNSDVRKWDFGEIGVDSPDGLMKQLRHNVAEAVDVYVQATSK